MPTEALVSRPIQGLISYADDRQCDPWRETDLCSITEIWHRNSTQPGTLEYASNRGSFLGLVSTVLRVERVLSRSSDTVEYGVLGGGLSGSSSLVSA